jgi:hypothetical protein
VGQNTGLAFGFPQAKTKAKIDRPKAMALKAARQRQNITKNTRSRFRATPLKSRDSLLLDKPFPQSIQLPKPRSKDGKQKLQRNQDLDLQQN